MRVSPSALSALCSALLLCAPTHAAILYYSDARNLHAIDTASGTDTVVLALTGVALQDLADGPLPTVLYAADSSNRELVLIDLGASPPRAQSIGPFGVSITTLAYDRDRNVLYGTDTRNLYQINQSDGSAVLVQPISGASQIWGLGFDPVLDQLYALDGGADSLFSIDVVSGKATLVGLIGIDRPTDVYAVSATSGLGVGNGTCCQELYDVNLRTGAWSSRGIELDGVALGLAGTSGATCSVRLGPGTLPGALEGVSYLQTLTATGGSGTGYTFALHFGRLPLGVTLAQVGPGAQIAGTPYEDGTFGFGIRVTDPSGCSIVHPYNLVVGDCPITLSPTTLPHGTLGDPYAVTLTASGGQPPYVYDVVAGALPPGLTLTSTGVVAGTPTLAGTFGFSVAARDATCAGSRAYALTIDGTTTGDNIVAGQGLGYSNPNRIRAFEQSGATTRVDLYAYGAGAWGCNVGAGNIADPAEDQILSGPGPGAVFGPQVRAFLADGTGMGKVNFFSYGTLKYGVNVSGQNVDGDAFSEILTGAGPGDVFGPHVRGFDFDASSVAPIARISFYAYATLKYGVNVDGGSVDGDAYSEILTGPGPSSVFDAVVRGWNHDEGPISAIAKINFVALGGLRFGVNVAGGDVDGDGFAEIAAAPGPGDAASYTSRFLGFDYDATQVAALPGFDVKLPVPTLFGGRVGVGDVTGDGTAELLAGPGRDPAAPSIVHPYAYVDDALQLLLSFDAFPQSGYGVNVVSAALGY